MSTEGSAVLTLGRGMANRARSQTVLGPNRFAAGLIGAVGRASVGFGLAVGRSRSIRPTVNLSDVNSSALRPPTNFWRPGADDEPVGEFTSVGAERIAVSESPSTRSTAAAKSTATSPTTPATPATTVRRATTPGAKPPTGAGHSRRAARRPTWTDQIIQRSAIGYVAPPAGAMVAPLPVPDDFEPFGDPKLDRLRLLMRANASGENPAATRPAQRATRDAGRSPSTTAGQSGSATAGQSRSANSLDGRPDRSRGNDAAAAERGDTAAGRATGPGRFGQLIRPELVEGRRPSTTGRPGSTVGSTLPDGGHTRTTEPGTIRRTPQPATATEPSKVDRLRDLLIGQGKLTSDDTPTHDTPTHDTPTHDDPTPNDAITTVRRTTAAEPQRGTGDPDRSATRRASTELTSQLRAGRPPLTDRASGPSGTSPDTRRADPRSPDPRRSTDGTVDAPAQGRSLAGTATALATRPPLDLVPDSRRTDSESEVRPARPAVDPTNPADTRSFARRSNAVTPQTATPHPPTTEGAATGTPATSAPASGAVASGAVSTAADLDLARGADDTRSAATTTPDALRQQLRVQRLLRTGLAAAPRAADPNPDVRVDALSPNTDAEAVSRRRVAPPVRHVRRRPDRPRLPLAGDDGREPVLRRRLSLPRTLSQTHRPSSSWPRSAPTPTTQIASTLASDHIGDRVGPSTAASSSATSGLPVAPVARSVDDLRSSVATTTRHDPAAAAAAATDPVRPVARRGSTVVPAGTGALLAAVRRRAASIAAPSAMGATGATTLATSSAPQGRATTTSTSATSNAASNNPASSNPATSKSAATTVASAVDSTPSPVVTPRSVAPPAVAQRSLTSPVETARSVTARSVTSPVEPSPVVAPAQVAPRTLPTSIVATQAAATPTATAPEVEPPVMRPAERLAEQFMSELSRTVRRTPAPLPTTYRPMADTIAGGRTVMLSTDPASRRALRSVRKVAATTGDTIHLDPASVPTRRLDEVIAHELTHVAHPSPTPRFFDDIDDSPEERKAEQIARVMARSPLAPSASVVAPGGRTTRADVVRRSPAPTTTTSPGTVSADALAARLTGSTSAARSSSPGSHSTPSISTSPGRSDTIRRSPALPSNLTSTLPSTPSDPAVIRRAISPTIPQSSNVDIAASPAVEMSDNDFIEHFRSNLPEIMSLIEDRMIIELERRGGRTWGAL